MELGPKIRLNIWENIRNPKEMMILYDFQNPYGDSETYQKNWKIFYTFIAYNPLIPPYPAGSELFLARHSDKYPNELIEIKSMRDIYNINESGTYFVGYTAPYVGMSKIPFKNTYVFVEEGRFINNYTMTSSPKPIQ